MPNVELTISVPSLLVGRLAADACKVNLPVERHVAQVLLGEIMRRDAQGHTASLAETPEANARAQRDTVIGEIERDVARLIADGLEVADAAATIERLIEQYDLTQAPGYLDPGNRSVPMTAERHIAILRATLRADHQQSIADNEALATAASDRGDERARRRYLAEAERLRAQPLP